MSTPANISDSKSRTLAIVVLISTLTFVFSPLATVGFNGFSPDQFPVQQIDPPVQPAGYAFSIWGLIYLWLIVGAGFGLWRASDDPDWRAMRPALAISLIIGTFWIAAANVVPVLATIMIVVMTFTAILSMLGAGQNLPWLQVRPVAIYAGWLTAASGAGIGIVLGGYAIMPAQSAAILCIVGVLFIAFFVQSSRPAEWGYPAAVIWALTGVIVANISDANLPVIVLAAVGIALLTIRTVHFLVKGPRL